MLVPVELTGQLMPGTIEKTINDLMQQHKNADTEALKESLSDRIKKKARTIEKAEQYYG
ncbi:MAG: hypothetical protein JSR44_01295 [Spirochaetes bacterium]|nr:hypothetical protein [Spirochaetota bacterium]